LPPVHVLGHPVLFEEVRELVGDALGAVAAESLIREGDRQLLAVRIGHHARELSALGALVRRLLGAGLAQERFAQLERTGRETSLGRWVARGIHARFRPQCTAARLHASAAVTAVPVNRHSNFLLSSTRDGWSTSAQRRVRLARRRDGRLDALGSYPRRRG